jgi:hypothetical protein
MEAKQLGTNQINRDLMFLECVQWMRKEFAERLCNASSSRDPGVLATLRLEATYQVAEFFYLLSARGLKTADQLKSLIEHHNEYIVTLTKDPAKMERLGLTKDRMLDAIFTADVLPRALQSWSERPGAFDQSNLARLLAVIMSTETCRKVVIACHNAGFFDRQRTPFGMILVSSRGVLEETFSRCVSEARRRLDVEMGDA